MKASLFFISGFFLIFLFNSDSVHSQEYILQATKGSIKSKTHGKWTNWSDWRPMESTINIYSDRITFVTKFQTTKVSTYLIAGNAKDHIDAFGNRTVSFDCIDEDGQICNIKTAEVNNSEERIQVSVEYSNVATKYITIPFQSENEWEKITLKSTEFYICFPEKPKYINRLINDDKNKSVLQHFYTYPSDNSIPWYAITYFELPKGETFDLIEDKDPLIDGFISICQGRITSGKYNFYLGVKTYDFDLYSGSSVCFGKGRILSINNYVFLLIYLYDEFDSNEYEKFYGSLTFK